MRLFFLIFFIFISIILIALILSQPGKGFNHTTHSNIKNNIKIFNNIGASDFIAKIIGIFSCFFLITSIILCNLNKKIAEPDYFWENNKKNIIINKNTNSVKKEELNTDIPR